MIIYYEIMKFIGKFNKFNMNYDLFLILLPSKFVYFIKSCIVATNVIIMLLVPAKSLM